MSFFVKKILWVKSCFTFLSTRGENFPCLTVVIQSSTFLAKIYENFDTRIEGARSKSLQVRLKSTIWITAKPLLKAWNKFFNLEFWNFKIGLTFKSLVCGPDLTLSSDLIKKI